MKKVGFWLINIVLVIVFIFTCAGTFAEKSVGYGIATIIVVGLFIYNLMRFRNGKDVEFEKMFDSNEWKQIGTIKPDTGSLKMTYFYVNENKKIFNVNGKEYNFKDLISAQIVEDNKEYTISTYRENLLGNRVIGQSGIAKYVKKLEIKLILNSISEPQVYITLLKGNNITTGLRYKNARQMAEKFLSTFEVIINNKD